VEWIDTDAAGIHHNSTVVRWAEAAEAVLMREAGLDGYFASAPRVRYEADFLAPVRFGDEVAATVRVEEVGRTSLALAFEVRSGEVVAARGRYVTVHVGVDGRPEPWPEAWRAALTASG
jgi:acyl-CoA thioester hydrolase